jgi:Metallo-peptidase family M12/IPT/TIG domain/Reprolysin family propeptide
MDVRSFVSACLVVAALAAAPHAQQGPLLAPQRVIDTLAVGEWTEQWLVLPAAAEGPLVVDLQLEGAPARLLLEPHSLRAPGFTVLVQGADGALVAVPAAPAATFRGHVQGQPGSVVAASLLADGLHAFVRLPGRAPFGVQPASIADPRAPRGLHLVYAADDGIGEPGLCGTPDAAPGAHAPAQGPAETPAPDVVCQIALDADFEYYQSNGSSVPATELDIENIINGVDAIYTQDVDVNYLITTILVRTAEPDPYSSTSPSTLLDQVDAHWSSSQGGIVRDIAHLFTGKNLSGSVIGIAKLSVICSQSNGFGLSQSKFSGNFTSRVALTAHELGHNWSAEHCDAQPDCSIMCSGLGGCSGNVTEFSASSVVQINQEKASSGCLSPAVPPPPPVIAFVNPGAVQVFQGATVTVIGENFAEANGVTVDGQGLHQETGYTIVSDTQITFDAPTPDALGPVTVTVSNPSGTSNPGNFSYVETSPPQLMVPAVGFTTLSLPWEFGGGPGDTAFLLVGLAPTNFLFQGQTILATNLILSSAPLDAVGLGSFALVLPASAAGITIYSQVVTLDGGTVKATLIHPTWIVL